MFWLILDLVQLVADLFGVRDTNREINSLRERIDRWEALENKWAEE